MLAKPWWNVPASSPRRATALQALQVFQARSKSGHRVAIKHMPCKPGAKLTSMQRRGMDVLRKIHGHPNAVNLQEVNMTGFGVELVGSGDIRVRSPLEEWTILVPVPYRIGLED